MILTNVVTTEEIEALLAAAGLQHVGTVRQLRERPDPRTFLGRGKLGEVRALLEQHPHPLSSTGHALIVVNAELKPPVLFNLEDELRAEVWDRIRVILEIFQRNAHVKEARLQVELARLRYELPFVHEALHRQLTGEHPGFMGGGELEARTYETHLKRRTKALLRDLDRVRLERRTRRTGRRRSGLRLVAIAGYTNSGKSSLLNKLTGSEVASRPQVFTTLETTTRRLQSGFHVGHPNDLLFTDTVGFIRDLPPWLVDAFGSTLEEVAESDAVLLVVDASEDAQVVEEKLETGMKILERIHAPRRLGVLLHKADLLDGNARTSLLMRLRRKTLGPSVPVLFTSTHTGEGLAPLVSLLLGTVLETREGLIELDRTKPDHLRFEHWLRSHTDLLAHQDTGARRLLRFRCAADQWGLLLREARGAGLRLSS